MSIRKKSSLPRLARLRGLNRMNSQLVSDILELLNGLRFGFVVVCHDCLYGTFFLWEYDTRQCDVDFDCFVLFFFFVQSVLARNQTGDGATSSWRCKPCVVHAAKGQRGFRLRREPRHRIALELGYSNPLHLVNCFMGEFQCRLQKIVAVIGSRKSVRLLVNLPEVSESDRKDPPQTIQLTRSSKVKVHYWSRFDQLWR